MNGTRYFSMFTGVGGFELGIGEKGECVGVCEIDKYASTLLSQRFEGTKNFGDARTINTSELPDFDLLVGGFPCQAFSIAGKRRGFDDTRGTLFFEVARIIKAKRPKLVLLENVKGLLNHNKGETFSVILQTLEELGYNVEWMVLNSKFFGVPQNRERVYIIGSLRGEPRPEILPFPRINEEVIPEHEVSHTLISGYGKIPRGTTMIQMPETRGNSQGARIYETEGVSQTISSGGGGMGAKTGLYNTPMIVASRGRNPNNPSDRTTGSPTEQRLEINSEGISNSLTSVQKDNLVVPCLNPNDLRKGYSGQNRKTLEKTGMVRRLTPLECERLQGFPDNWTEGFSDTQRYKMMGNAVTVKVIRAIAGRLII